MTLIERIEAASGADRESDWKIQELLDGNWPETTNWPPFMVGSKMEKAIPHYTASIDAALTLVPEVWDWNVGYQDGAWANVSPTSQPFAPELDITTEAATPALALCAAALRAREAQQ